MTGVRRKTGIAFSEDDLREVILPHKDSLVVELTIGSYQVKRVLIDNDSQVNVFYWEFFNNNKLEVVTIKPSSSAFDRVQWAIGPIHLLVKIRDVQMNSKFIIHDCPLAYNAFIGRDSHPMGGIPSSSHKVPRRAKTQGKTQGQPDGSEEVLFLGQKEKQSQEENYA